MEICNETAVVEIHKLLLETTSLLLLLYFDQSLCSQSVTFHNPFICGRFDRVPLYLKAIYSSLSGVFILNLVCRNTTLRDQVVSDLHTLFPELYSIGIEGEVNEIVIALPQLRYQTETEEKKSLVALRTLFHSSVMKLQKFAKSDSHSWDPTLDLCQLVQNVQIV